MDVSEEIRRFARKAILEWHNGHINLEEAVAGAILAERERCAKIADEEVRECNEASKRAKAAGQTSEMYGRNAGLHSAARIAACIRDDLTP